MTDAARRTDVCYRCKTTCVSLYEVSMQSIMWRRTDVLGMEACAFNQVGTNATISGAALYADGDTPTRLEYSVTCTANWEC
ncbi:MAG: putative glycolipid-binding domain-containing protein, partial [Paracoccaceae bacterium]